MPKSNITYQAKQEMIGKHLRSNQWVLCTGSLTIYDRKINPIVLRITNEIHDSFIREFMEEKKQFKGNSVSEVFGKLSKWYFKNEIIFQY